MLKSLSIGSSVHDIALRYDIINIYYIANVQQLYLLSTEDRIIDLHFMLIILALLKIIREKIFCTKLKIGL